MTKKNTHTISRRIKHALWGLTIGLSLLFTLIIFLLVYVVEDQVFVNVLRQEHQHFPMYDIDLARQWQPQNRAMRLVIDKKQLPKVLQNLVTNKTGIYEYFEGKQAYFVLYNKHYFPQTDQTLSYFLTYDVSELLSVRGNKDQLTVMVTSIALLILAMATWIASRLSGKILKPLKHLTDQLQHQDHLDIAKGFSKPFAGDEIGTLAQQLEMALQNAQQSAQKAFEFNRGVSHELRSPIQVAINATELINLQHPDLYESVTMQRLHRAINQLQTISQAFLWLVSDQPQGNSHTIIKPLMARLINNHDHKQRLIVHPIKKSLQYAAPEFVLNVIFENLINNAIQHGSDEKITLILQTDRIQINNQVEPNNSDTSMHQEQTYHTGMGLIIIERLCQKLGWKLNQQHTKTDAFHVSIEHISSRSLHNK